MLCAGLGLSGRKSKSTIDKPQYGEKKINTNINVWRDASLIPITTVSLKNQERRHRPSRLFPASWLKPHHWTTRTTYCYFKGSKAE
ncbi:unnamed protein product [Pleuronectes platessa]|uniref:Uncharacterized protein n=1 Tax=Pleuronectes platessa TaxID=8262 RepID=A0A9N7Z1N7_PLEPL|nr:unnamed protein product [Pleuronectes platessa]